MKKPELLMPAGNLERLKIAVKNGANAVYFGAPKFNARQLAQNFTPQEIKEGIDFCHAHNAKAYLTLNTLIKDNEMKEALEVAKEAYESNIDAIIIQDFGLFKAIKELFPTLELHASTQMTCNNIQGAELLAQMGFKKIVLARELNIEEIKEISKLLHEKNCEVEVFIHGAECFSFSGQCLFSSFAFNTSGNRGRCLQPCRLAYETNTGKKGRLLSMKDLATYNDIGKLIEAGIDSFKVEGRLKSNEYIQNVAKVYRKQIDGYYDKQTKASEAEINEMKKAYLRENGMLYLTQENELTTITTAGNMGLAACKILSFKGKDIIVELYEDLNRSDKLTKIIDDKYENTFVRQIFSREREIPFGRAGQKVLLNLTERPFLNIGDILYFTSPKQFNPGKTLTVDYDLKITAETKNKIKFVFSVPMLKFYGKKSFIEGESEFVVDKAEKMPTPSKIIEEKLFKDFYFFKPNKFECTVSNDAFIPLSELKELKRIINTKVQEELFPLKKDDGNFFSKVVDLLKISPGRGARKEKDYFIFVEKGQEDFLKKLPKSSAVVEYYNENTNKAIVKAPNIMSSNEMKAFEKKAVEGKWTVFCSNIGSFQIALKNKLNFYIDREMNCFNSLAVDFFLEKGAKGIVPSVELSLIEMTSLSQREKIIPLIFFYPLLMTSKAYSKNNVFGKDEFLLKDRKEFLYRIKLENGLVKIYNPAPVDMAYEVNKFADFTTLGIDFKSASKKEVEEFLDFLDARLNNRKAKKDSKFTRGHYEKPIE